jgi:hypothetical protein
MCWRRGEESHARSNCAEWLAFSEESSGRSKSTYATWSNAFDKNTGFTIDEVLLDNQADFSIMHSEFLSSVKRVRTAVKDVIGGMVLQYEEHHEGFGIVKSDPRITVDILFFDDIEDMYPTTYLPQDSFTVHLLG